MKVTLKRESGGVIATLEMSDVPACGEILKVSEVTYLGPIEYIVVLREWDATISDGYSHVTLVLKGRWQRWKHRKTGAVVEVLPLHEARTGLVTFREPMKDATWSVLDFVDAFTIDGVVD